MSASSYAEVKRLQRLKGNNGVQWGPGWRIPRATHTRGIVEADEAWGRSPGRSTTISARAAWAIQWLRVYDATLKHMAHGN